MKKRLLYGLIGILAILLFQNPVALQAMDSGMMDSGGYRGYNMGPGMMGSGGYQAYGMGPGMMGPGYDNGSHNRQNQTNLNKKGAERIFADYLQARHNPNLKLGEIKDEGSFFEANLLTQNNSLVDRLIVDKDTGRIRSAY
jgi:hypothetical protein